MDKKNCPALEEGPKYLISREGITPDEIAQIIENFAPLELAEPWDFCGFAVDNSISDVKKIMLALTVTDDVVTQAREQNCDMIISHHPLFYVPLDYKDLTIYCAHTNLDKTQGGTTDELIRVLGLYYCEEKQRFDETIQFFIRYIKLETPISIEEFGEKLKKVSNNIRLVNNKNTQTIQKIAFCAGSGSDFIQEAYENGAEALVTGDVKFHCALENPIVIFDIGHFESEIPVLKVLGNLLKEKIEIVYAVEKNPFKTL